MNVNNTTYKGIENNKKNFFIFLFILMGLALVMIYCFMPLDKINPGHDYLFHYKRMLTLMESIKENNSLLYIDSESLNNYGYATKWFYSDFILIPFAFIGNYIGIAATFKVMYFVTTLLCGIFTYITTNRIYKNTIAASFSGLIFAFCAYRIQDIFERSALGESLSFTFIPLVIWGLYEIIKGDYRKWYIISIGFSLMIFTHIISIALMLVVVCIFCIIYNKNLIKEPKRILYLIIAGIASILLSGYFLFPFFEQLLSNNFYFENAKVNVSTTDPIALSKLVYGMVTIGLPFIKSLSFYPYMGLLITIAISLRLLIRNKKATHIKSADIAVVIGIILILTSLNTKIWEYYPLKLFNFIQFPWRLFEFSSFLFAIAGGYYASIVLKNKKLINIGLIVSISIISISIILFSNTYKFYHDYNNHKIPASTFSNQYMYLMGFEYLPLKLTDINIILDKGENVSCINNDTKISGYKKEKNNLIFDITITKPDKAELPLIYYKGYYAKVNEQIIPVHQSEKGFVEIPIEKTGHIEVSFSGTPIQKYSIYATIISYLLLGIYILINKKNESKKYNRENI